MKAVATLLPIFLFLACGAAEETQPEATDPDAPPLNFVIITMDTCRADALSAYGQKLPTSPRIDAMAADGLLFEQALSSAPSTLPSHASLFTGKQPYAHGVRSNLGYELPEANVTVAEVLHSRGYRTAAEIAAPVLARGRKLEQGFDFYRDPGLTETVLEKFTAKEAGRRRLLRDAEEITKAGIEFLNENRDRPFLLWLHYFDAHRPYGAPPEFQRRIPESPYLAEVARVDHAVGRVVDEIERLGIRGHTLVVVTADHGEGLGEHGEESHSFFVYDSTIRVPLILWGPNAVPRGRRAASLVRLIDVAPTILDLVGAPAPPDMQGTSLRPLFDDPDRDLSLTAYGESIEPSTTFGASALRFVRDGRWKYIHKLDPELYDIEADPAESRNLAEAHPEVVEKMRARLRSLIESAPEKPVGSEVKMDASTLQQLHALGYVGGPAPAAFSDEVTELEVRGPDPTTRIEDVWKVSVGLGFLMNSKYTEAEAILREVVDNNPTSIYPLQTLITAIHPQERPDEEILLLRRLIEMDPESPSAKSDLAKLLRGRGEVEEAEGLFRQALLLGPCEMRTRLHLSDLLSAEERYADKIAILDTGEDGCFESQIVLNALAYTLATSPADDVRDGARALAIAEEIVEESSGQHPDYLDTLACAHAELGQFEQAVDYQQQAISLLEGHDIPQAAETYAAHLALFEAGEPVREP